MLVAGHHQGVGKTTVCVGLIAWMRWVVLLSVWEGHRCSCKPARDAMGEDLKHPRRAGFVGLAWPHQSHMRHDVCIRALPGLYIAWESRRWGRRELRRAVAEAVSSTRSRARSATRCRPGAPPPIPLPPTGPEQRRGPVIACANVPPLRPGPLTTCVLSVLFPRLCRHRPRDSGLSCITHAYRCLQAPRSGTRDAARRLANVTPPCRPPAGPRALSSSRSKSGWTPRISSCCRRPRGGMRCRWMRGRWPPTG